MHQCTLCQAVALDISKTFNRSWHAALLKKSYGNPFLFLHFSYYKLLTFKILSVILLSMQMILLSVIRDLVYGNDQGWIFKLYLIYMKFRTSKLDWSSYIVSTAKTASKKIGALISSMNFLSPEVALYLYKSTIKTCMKYYCHVQAGAPSCYLEMLHML